MQSYIVNLSEVLKSLGVLGSVPKKSNPGTQSRNAKDVSKRENPDQRRAQPTCFAYGAANHTTTDGHEYPINPVTGEKYENKEGKRHPIGQAAHENLMAARSLEMIMLEVTLPKLNKPFLLRNLHP